MTGASANPKHLTMRGLKVEILKSNNVDHQLHLGSSAVTLPLSLTKYLDLCIFGPPNVSGTGPIIDVVP